MVALGWYAYWGPGPLNEEKTALIARGAHVTDMAEILSNEGIVYNRWLFLIATVASGQQQVLKAGEYRFAPGASLHDVILRMARGEVVVHKFTVPEGLNVREIIALMKNEPGLSGEAPADIAEGTLLPQTYYFIYGDDRAQLLARMQKAMQETLRTLWEGREQSLPFATPEQAVVLASIVEKETGVPQERPRVAAVFINRLRLGMKLQADPTVRYGAELQGPLGHALTTTELQTPTPYNTYVIEGLPSAPIANPGVASLQAVLRPAATDELYFVATGKGGHHFARTLEEHNANVRLYRANEH